MNSNTKPHSFKLTCWVLSFTLLKKEGQEEQQCSLKAELCYFSNVKSQQIGKECGDWNGSSHYKHTQFFLLKRGMHRDISLAEKVALLMFVQKPQEKSTKTVFPVKKKLGARRTEAKKNVIAARSRSLKKRKFVRHVLPRKTKRSHKPYYDEVDMKALRLMSKL